MNEIVINRGPHALVRITFDTLDEVTIETNLSQGATAEAVACAMVSIARWPWHGPGVEVQARDEAAQARASDPTSASISKALARMVSELNTPPGVTVDLGDDWTASSETAN